MFCSLPHCAWMLRDTKIWNLESSGIYNTTEQTWRLWMKTKCFQEKAKKRSTQRPRAFPPRPTYRPFLPWKAASNSFFVPDETAIIHTKIHGNRPLDTGSSIIHYFRNPSHRFLVLKRLARFLTSTGEKTSFENSRNRYIATLQPKNNMVAFQCDGLDEKYSWSAHSFRGSREKVKTVMTGQKLYAILDTILWYHSHNKTTYTWETLTGTDSHARNPVSSHGMKTEDERKYSCGYW